MMDQSACNAAGGTHLGGGTTCPPGNCFQPAFARAMIPSASGVVSAASAHVGALRSFEGVSGSVGTLAETEATYLRRYIDQMAGRAGGGSAFAFPDAAAGAGNWPAFQRAIGAWQPVGGGGGAVAADPSGQLAAADFEAFAAANQYLAPVREEFVRRAPHNVTALLRLVEVCVDGGFESSLFDAQARLADAYSGAPAPPDEFGDGWAAPLTSFQERDLGKLLELNHGANFSVPGAGKTRVALAAMQAFRGYFKNLIAGFRGCLSR